MKTGGSGGTAGWCLATGPALVKRETLRLTSDEKRALSSSPFGGSADAVLACADEVIK
jgi:hypothetical protein